MPKFVQNETTTRATVGKTTGRLKNGEKMTYIKFSYDYSKLEENTFTTIRRYDRYDPSEHITVKTPTKTFPAIIIGKTKARLSQLSDSFLLRDTDTKNRADAIKVLNSFYRKPVTEDEVLTILIIEKVKK